MVRKKGAVGGGWVGGGRGLVRDGGRVDGKRRVVGEMGGQKEGDGDGKEEGCG